MLPFRTPMHLLPSLAIAAALLLAVPVHAQVAAPTGQDQSGGIAPAGGGSTGNSGSSGSSGAGIITITPPSGAGISMEPPVSLEPTPTATGSLAPIRGDQAYTTSALMGSVNGKPIFVQDVLAPIDEPLRRLAQSARNLRDFREGAGRLIGAQLRNLESEIFVVSAAENSLTEREKEGINVITHTKEQQLRTDHGGSVAAADKFLRAQGSSYDKAIADIRRKATVMLYQQRMITPRVVVTRDMVLAAYHRDLKSWHEEPQVELYSLRLRVSRWLPRTPTTDGTLGRLVPNPTPEQVAAAEKQALDTARDLVQKIQATPVEKRGAEFARIVEDYGVNDTGSDNTYSRGGRTADVKPGTFQNQDLEKLIFSLPANSIGEPLLVRDASPVNSTVYIIMIGDKKEARTVPFTEAQHAIYDQLRTAKSDELWRGMMDKLFNPNAVEAVERMLPVAVEAAVARYATK